MKCFANKKLGQKCLLDVATLVNTFALPPRSAH